MNATINPSNFVLQDSVPMHDATRLTEGGVQARIVLHGQIYTLRITKAGKLILTK